MIIGARRVKDSLRKWPILTRALGLTETEATLREPADLGPLHVCYACQLGVISSSLTKGCA